MKRILMFILILISLFSINVYAQDQYELTQEKHPEVYYSRYGKVYASYPFIVFKFGDIFAYCIEPGNHITTDNYVIGKLDDNYDQNKLEKLELIGYYGRDYPGHDNLRYSMATQALVWELTGVDKVTFWTKKNEEGEEIDVTKEKNEILELVNNHYKKPSFKTSYKATLNHELVLEDSNNVLENYEVISVHNTYIEGNKLHIIPSKTGIDYIKLVRKNYDNNETIIFVGKDDSNTQKMAKLHYSSEVKLEFSLITEGARLVIHKLDENNNPIKVGNIKFMIKNTKGYYVCSSNPDCIYKTDENGVFITDPLEEGEYEIEELENQVIEGYTWNKNKLSIKVNKEGDILYSDELGSYIDVSFINQSVKGTIEITKLGEEAEFNDEVTYKEIELNNIEFDIYDSNNKVIETIKTNENGIAKANNLPIGNYYIKEKTKLDNYIDSEKIDFEIKQEDQYQEIIKVNLNVKNILKKGKLEFTKVDKDTNVGIPNTIIEIYNDNDELLFTKETDEYGKFEINNLPYGNYYLIEKEPNSLYNLTNEIINFEIKENNEVVKRQMVNERIEIKVPKTRTNEDIIAHSIFGIVFLIGLGGMIYEKKVSY